MRVARGGGTAEELRTRPNGTINIDGIDVNGMGKVEVLGDHSIQRNLCPIVGQLSHILIAFENVQTASIQCIHTQKKERLITTMKRGKRSPEAPMDTSPSWTEY